MNEVEKKVRFSWERLLERDHGVDRRTDKELINGLWANIADDCIEDVCNKAGTIEDLVDDAVEMNLYKRYMGALHEEDLLEDEEAVGREIYFHEDLVKEGVAPDNELKRMVRTRDGALSKYLSKVATIEPSVVRFRDRVLGSPDGVLSPEEATDLLHSLALNQHPTSPKESGTLVWFKDEEVKNVEHITVWPGSELWKLKHICQKIAKKYRWSEGQVCYLVLTGRPIKTVTSKSKVSRSYGNGVAAHKYNRATIRIEVDAWMPAEYVRLGYHIIQRELLGENNRQPKLRNVKLFEFVVDHSTLKIVESKEGLAKLTIPTWKRLRELWNEHYPKGHAWHYGEGREHRFSRDFYRAQKAVIGTHYGLPGAPGEPRTYAESKEAFNEFVERLSAQVEQSK